MSISWRTESNGRNFRRLRLLHGSFLPWIRPSKNPLPARIWDKASGRVAELELRDIAEILTLACSEIGQSNEAGLVQKVRKRSLSEGTQESSRV